MSGMVLRKHGEFFVTAESFIPLYERLTEQHLSINTEHNMLMLETPQSLKNAVAGIQIEKRINGSLITIQANSKLGDVESWLKPDGWLFVTIMGGKADTASINATKPFGAVRKVLAFQSPASLQLTFHVNPDVVFRVEIVAESLWPWHSTYPTAC